MKRALAALVVIACGGHPDGPPAELDTGCAQGSGASCFALGSWYHVHDGDTKLDRPIAAWQRGCELGNAGSCGQLGTIFELGMGGHKADRVAAKQYHTLACRGGDRMSCEDLGIPVPPPPFDWAGALEGVLGPHAGELGASFGDYTLGQPMPPALAAWQTTFHTRVRVDTEDASVRGSHPSLELRFEGQHGLDAQLAQRWGKPSLATGAWVDAAHHRIAFAGDDGQAAFLTWMPYRSLEELVRADDPARLGLEPVPLLGATIEQVQQALGTTHVFRDGEEDYSWYDYGLGPIETHATTAHGTIVHARISIITNDGRASQWFVELLGKKYGPPRTAGDRLVWAKPHLSVTKPAPNSGNVDLELGSVATSRAAP